jgi:hypothetical protein
VIIWLAGQFIMQLQTDIKETGTQKKELVFYFD